MRTPSLHSPHRLGSWGGGAAPGPSTAGDDEDNDIKYEDDGKDDDE
jgi:hypothetical protein